jgi:hypothetical protein
MGEPTKGAPVHRVTEEEARAEGLVCCPNPFCWNGSVDGKRCAVCNGRGVDPVTWIVICPPHEGERDG